MISYITIDMTFLAAPTFAQGNGVLSNLTQTDCKSGLPSVVFAAAARGRWASAPPGTTG